MRGKLLSFVRLARLDGWERIRGSRYATVIFHPCSLFFYFLRDLTRSDIGTVGLGGKH